MWWLWFRSQLITNLKRWYKQKKIIPTRPWIGTPIIVIRRMSFFNYILVPFLFLAHLSIAYAIPVVATLRSRNNGQRWIIHWVLFILLRLTVFRVWDWLFDGAVYWLLIVFSELALLFALAQHVIRDQSRRKQWNKSSSKWLTRVPLCLESTLRLPSKRLTMPNCDHDRISAMSQSANQMEWNQIKSLQRF